MATTAAATAFAAALREPVRRSGGRAFSGSVFDLVSGAWENTAEPVRIDGREEKAQAAKSNKDRAYDALLDAARRLMEEVSECQGLANKELYRLVDRVNQITHDMRK